MALVDKKIKDFDVTAFKAGEEDFFQVKRDDIKGKWSVFFFFILLILPLYALLNLGT